MIHRIKSLLGQSKKQQPNNNQYSDINEHEWSIFKAVQPFTMTNIERIKALLDSINFIAENDIEGDIVECGVWKGGSMMATIKQLNHIKEKRTLWLYDTFAGMSEPTEDDIDNKGRRAKDRLLKENKLASNVWAYSDLKQVQQNIQTVNSQNLIINYIEGKVEETLIHEKNLPDKIAILRLDTDWYESTKTELEILLPRVSKNGIVIIDDYGHWKGCKKAVDEYIEKNTRPIFLSRIDYTCRIFINL